MNTYEEKLSWCKDNIESFHMKVVINYDGSSNISESKIHVAISGYSYYKHYRGKMDRRYMLIKRIYHRFHKLTDEELHMALDRGLTLAIEKHTDAVKEYEKSCNNACT